MEKHKRSTHMYFAISKFLLDGWSDWFAMLRGDTLTTPVSANICRLKHCLEIPSLRPSGSQSSNEHFKTTEQY